MDHGRKNYTATIAIIGSLILAIILVAGTMWMGARARRDTEEAVRSVSLLYLDELAGRREQVVEDNLQEKIQTIRVAIDLMTGEDISDKAHLEAYQTRMKQLYKLDKFAFVDTEGLIYTSTGTQSDIDEYDFDYRTLSEPEISVFHPESTEKRVIIAVPVSIPFQGKTLSVCFMAIDMQEMLSGVSMTTHTGNATFCNIYTKTGAALTDSVLGGLAMEDNLLDAMQVAVFEPPYSYESFTREFQSGTRGVVFFTFNGIRETLAYIPVNGTDWQLTYLIRESVISERVSTISRGTVRRSMVQSALTVAAMLVMFGFIIAQTKRNSILLLEQETAEAASRVKQEELERIAAVCSKVPSARNQQVLRFRLVTRDTGADKVLKNIRLGAALPELHLPLPGTEPEAFIIICSTVEENKLVDIDLGIALQSMLLKAVEMGLNGLAIGAFDRTKIQEELELPLTPLMIVAIGKGIEKIELKPIAPEESHAYYREGGVHYVPKVKASDLLI